MLFTDDIEYRGKDDGEDVGDGQDSDGSRVIFFARTTSDGVVNLRQGDRARAVAATHDRQDVEHHDAIHWDPEHQTDSDAENRRADNAHQDGWNIAEQ